MSYQSAQFFLLSNRMIWLDRSFGLYAAFRCLLCLLCLRGRVEGSLTHLRSSHDFLVVHLVLLPSLLEFNRCESHTVALILPVKSLRLVARPCIGEGDWCLQVL